MKKKYIIIVIVVAIAGFFALARVLTSEDVWLCVNGAWQRHGQPSSSMPTTGCENEQKNTTISNINADISSFEDCVVAGLAVKESYPRQCSADGKTFTEDIGNELDKLDVIKISSPRPNEKIMSPLIITGEAIGTWYFEGIFLIKLIDANNNILATGNAESQSDWMTEDFVAFKATLEFAVSSGQKGNLILEKSNPSGLNQNMDQLIVPVTF